MNLKDLMERLRKEGADEAEEVVVKIINVVFDYAQEEVSKIAIVGAAAAAALAGVRMQLLAHADKIDGKDDPGR